MERLILLDDYFDRTKKQERRFKQHDTIPRSVPPPTGQLVGSTLWADIHTTYVRIVVGKGGPGPNIPLEFSKSFSSGCGLIQILPSRSFGSITLNQTKL
mmetsp:Transcript_30665/g.70086  ORF Transcript_30665/g.70086 Transcript_30665/m.70086 type:complete len:99 (+) Transcript_30665:38-334(+)